MIITDSDMKVESVNTNFRVAASSYEAADEQGNCQRRRFGAHVTPYERSRCEVIQWTWSDSRLALLHIERSQRYYKNK